MKNFDITIFNILMIGVDRFIVDKFSEIAYQYDCKVSSLHSMNNLKVENFFHVFIISIRHANYLSNINQLSIQFPHAFVVLLIEDSENNKMILELPMLFFILDKTTNKQLMLSMHQALSFLYVLNRQKLGLLNLNVSIAGGFFSLIEECYVKDGKSTKLTGKQVAMIKILLQYRGNIVSRTTMLNHVWTLDKKIVTDRVIDTNIVQLRRMFGDNGRNSKYLQTIFGQGYRLTHH